MLGMPSKLYAKVSTRGMSVDPAYQAHTSHMRGLWRSHVQSCLRRNIANQLTIDQYAALTQQPCRYCGTPPSNVTKFRTGEPITYNGIDRRINSKPYTVRNSVACCRTCNSMKSNLSARSFIAHVLRIASHTSPH